MEKQRRMCLSIRRIRIYSLFLFETEFLIAFYETNETIRSIFVSIITTEKRKKRQKNLFIIIYLIFPLPREERNSRVIASYKIFSILDKT